MRCTRTRARGRIRYGYTWVASEYSLVESIGISRSAFDISSASVSATISGLTIAGDVHCGGGSGLVGYGGPALREAPLPEGR